MKVVAGNGLKGAALLAAAGVSLADAQWVFASQRAGGEPQDQARLGEIRRKVNAFLAASSEPARTRLCA